MQNPYDIYPVDGADVSRHQDNPGTSKKPSIIPLVKAGFLFIVVRVGLGLVADALFEWFWTIAKGLLQRKPYWYGDYYSHRKDPVLAPQKVTDYHWGEMQGDKCVFILKGDYGEAGPIVWDGEESTGYGWKITVPYNPIQTALNRKYYNNILRGFRDRILALTGMLIEIYCSPGFIPNFADWVKDLTLWVAWYDRSKTKAQIIAECRRQGWRGKILFWQFASDGDINMDGVKDGISLGMETADLDLNEFIGDEAAVTPLQILEQWSKYSGSTPPVIPPATEDPTPPVVIPPATVKEFGQKNVIGKDGLNIRNKPKDLPGSYVYADNGWMPPGTPVIILETATYGPNIWHRIGFNQWCAELYNGTTFLR